MERLNQLMIDEVKSEKNCLILQRIQGYISRIPKVTTAMLHHPMGDTLGDTPVHSGTFKRLFSTIGYDLSRCGCLSKKGDMGVSLTEEEKINKFIFILLVKLFSLLILSETITEKILPFQNSVIDAVKNNDSNQSSLRQLIEFRQNYEDARDDITRKILKIEEQLAKIDT